MGEWASEGLEWFGSGGLKTAEYMKRVFQMPWFIIIINII